MGVYVKNEVEVGEVVESLLSLQSPKQRVDVKFSNPDIKYMQRKTGLSHKFVGRMIRIFGEPCVLESLRRFANGYQYVSGTEEAVFVGICRAVESVGKKEG
jgi:hypothetical protein